MNLPGVFEKYRLAIDTELKSVLDERRSPLYDMLRYHLGWIDEKGNPLKNGVGKALRPTLCLLGCEAAGSDYRRALPAAAGLELLHNFSLIHDDIQDGDLERRHRPTVWAVWGMPQAINAGTAMRILTNSCLARLTDRGFSADTILQLQRLMDEASLDLIEGQYLDIAFEQRQDVTVTDYLKMIGGKTGALIACSLEAGALLGTGDRCMIEQFRELGWNIGLSFQITDDILGIWGNRDITGKPLASDIRRRKKTLPIVHAIENARDGYKKTITGYFTETATDENGVNAVLDILNQTGAEDYARNMSRDYLMKARNILDGLDIKSDPRKELEDLLDFLEARNF